VEKEAMNTKMIIQPTLAVGLNEFLRIEVDMSNSKDKNTTTI
jgi:hypothetical protein